MNELPRLILPAHPDWIRLYNLAWKTAMGNISKDQFTGWQAHVTCMPGVPICWVWDSCFIALYARYSNGLLPAFGNLNNFYAHQDEDGFIAMAYNMETSTPAYGKRINPPLFAWAELDAARQTGDLQRLAKVLPHLVRLFDWYKANRRREDGLYWYEDSGSSGMDNSPRSGYLAEYLNGSDICHVDLISQQAYIAEVIAELASILADSVLATRFEQERAELLPLIQQHWCERTGFYYDLFYHNPKKGRHNYVNHRTLASFWPLFAGACSQAQAEKLVAALMDPDDFWTPHPAATLSQKDPNYCEDGAYWLGGVWAPTNYMLVRALRRYGYEAEARELTVKHLQAMSRVADNPEYGGIWECYAPDLDQPATRSVGGKLSRPNFVGWSGLGPISMLIEEIIGLECDRLADEIRWRINEEECGISGLRFGEGFVTLHYRSGEIDVTSDTAFTLHVTANGKKSRHAIVAGTGRINVG